jgi:predicted O-methyltransferase YrrM
MDTIVTNISSRQDFFKGKDTVAVGYPWLTFGAIITLESIVNKDMRVLELGGGGSTIWFAKNCKIVKTIETDKKWIDLLRKKIPDNTAIFWSLSELDSVEMIKESTDNEYDIILIDSGWLYDEKGKHSPNRRLLFETAIPKLKKGGYMIIDNYQHYGMKNFNYKGFEVYTFDDIGYSGRGTKICQKL